MSYVELDRFLDAAGKLADLWRRRLLRFEVAQQGGVSLVFDDAATPEVPEAGGGLYLDLEDAIDAAAARTAVEQFVATRSQPRLNFPEPEAPDIARTKYEAVIKVVDEAHVAELLIFRMTSKVPVLSAHDWEVVNRVADSSPRPGTQSARYGVVRLTTEQLSAIDWQTTRKVTLMALDEQRLGLLIEALTKLRDVLAVHPPLTEPTSEPEQPETGRRL